MKKTVTRREFIGKMGWLAMLAAVPISLKGAKQLLCNVNGHQVLVKAKEGNNGIICDAKCTVCGYVPKKVTTRLEFPDKEEHALWQFAQPKQRLSFDGVKQPDGANLQIYFTGFQSLKPGRKRGK